VQLRLLYLYRNLTRNWLRTLLTCAAVALPIVIYVLSAAVIEGLESYLDNSAKQLRLAVTHKSSIINPLPAGHRAKIESLDPTRTRLTAVCGLRWIGGRVENVSTPLSTIAADADTFFATYPDHQLAPDEIEAWQRDRQAIIVGRATAGQMGWNKGQRISILPTLPPYHPIEFHVISVAEDAEDPVTNWFRRDYLEELLDETGAPTGLVSFLFVKCATKADLDHYRVAIDQFFAGSIDETKTQDEKAFINEYITQQFNLPRNLAILCAVTVFVAVMAAANTMSMSFRDRTNEFATLKSMGFGRWFTFVLIQSESLLLCAAGGLAGALVPFGLFTWTPLKDYPVPLIQTLYIQPVVCVRAVGMSLLIGVAAAIWPSWQVLRLKVVEALRSLE